MKKYQLDLICSKDDTKPALNHVLFTKKHIVASDGHALACIPTKQFLLESFESVQAVGVESVEGFIDEIPEPGFFVHREYFQSFKKYHKSIEFLNGETMRLTYKEKINLIPISNNQNYPDWRSAIPPIQNIEVSNIIFDPQKLFNLSKALGCEKGSGLKLNPTGAGKAILVRTDDKDLFESPFGVIMPLMDIS